LKLLKVYSTVATTRKARCWMRDAPRTGCALRVAPMCTWCEQAIVEWSRRVISIVAYCHIVKLCEALRWQQYYGRHLFCNSFFSCIYVFLIKNASIYTNLSLQEPQDNVLIQVGPRNEYQYMYHIHPKQAAGTYFYHPHKHGSAYFQVVFSCVVCVLFQCCFIHAHSLCMPNLPKIKFWKVIFSSVLLEYVIHRYLLVSFSSLQNHFVSALFCSKLPFDLKFWFRWF